MTDTLIEQSTELFSEVHYIQADQVGSFAQPLPSEFYIRGSRDSISSDQISELKEDLVFKTADGSLPIVRVIEPLVYYIDAEGAYRWLNGNSRSRALIEMQAETKYKGFSFEPVPVRQYLGTIDKTIARRFQVASNDSTHAHTVSQINAALISDFNELVEQETESRGASKAKSYAIEVLSGAYNLSPVRVGHHLAISTAPTWLKDQIDAGNVAFDVALNMVKEASEKGSSVPLETIWHGCQALLSEKETKVTQKHFKKFVDQNLRSSVDVSEQSPEAFESGDQVPVTGEKAPKVFDSAKAQSDILSTVLSYGSLDLTDLQPDKVGDNIVTTVAAAAAVISYLLQKQAVNKSVIVNVFDTIQTLLFDLLTDDEGNITLPDTLDETELPALLRLCQPLGKQTELLTSIANGSDSLEVDEDESDDEDSEDDSVESDDEVLEVEEYKLETI